MFLTFMSGTYIFYTSKVMFQLSKILKEKKIMKNLAEEARKYIGKNVYTDLGFKCEHTCAEFVSFILAKCGYPDVTSTLCTPMKNKMSANEKWCEPEDWMKEGDVIFFDWDHIVEERPLDHVAIVCGIDGNTVNYINANGSDHTHITIDSIDKNSSRISYWMRPKENAPSSPDKVVTIELRQLRRGMSGKDVKSLQQLLISKGYSVGVCGDDGDFGENTEKAVRNFQTDRKLSADGIVGEKTWAELFR